MKKTIGLDQMEILDVMKGLMEINRYSSNVEQIKRDFDLLSRLSALLDEPVEA